MLMKLFLVLCMISASAAFLQVSRRGSDGTRLFARKTPKQYMEQKNRKIKRRNEDRLLRLKKQRIEEKSAPHATFSVNSTVALSDDKESSSMTFSDQHFPSMMNASFLMHYIDTDAERKKIEALHKAAMISDRRHRNSFLQVFTKEESTESHANHQRRSPKQAPVKSEEVVAPSSSSPSFTSTSPSSIVSSDNRLSPSSSSSSIASKLRRKSACVTSRAARRSKIGGKGGEMIKGGKSSLKDGFKAPEFKRLPDMENKMRYHSSFPLRNTG